MRLKVPMSLITPYISSCPFWLPREKQVVVACANGGRVEVVEYSRNSGIGRTSRSCVDLLLVNPLLPTPSHLVLCVRSLAAVVLGSIP